MKVEEGKWQGESRKELFIFSIFLFWGKKLSNCGVMGKRDKSHLDFKMYSSSVFKSMILTC